MREPVINQGKVNTSQVQYNGKVYCATTRTGVLMVRRNGKICLSGNSTPFEFAGAVFEVQAPIMVFREWHRHRTQCLAGDTLITCVSPRGTSYKRTIKQIFDLKHGGVVDNAPATHKNGTSKAGTPVTRPARRQNPWRVRVLPNCQERTLRVLNERTMEFEVAQMADVWESGEKEVFEIRVGGRFIKASSKHPFFTKEHGWVELGELRPGMHIARMGKVAGRDAPYPKSLRAGIGVWTTMMRGRKIPTDPHACAGCGLLFPRDVLELDHIIPVRQSLIAALDPDNLQPLCDECHRSKTDTEQWGRLGMTKRGVRWDRIVEMPISRGIEQTYDIEMAGEHHNFVANDFVVHNCFNEVSARYVEMKPMFYIPSDERLAAGGQSKTNKQASGQPLDADVVSMSRTVIKQSGMRAYQEYQTLLDHGVARELARLVLPVNIYSRMRVAANLRNWCGFLTLRQAPNAQWEIQRFADVIAGSLSAVFPHVLELHQASRAT